MKWNQRRDSMKCSYYNNSFVIMILRPCPKYKLVFLTSNETLLLQGFGTKLAQSRWLQTCYFTRALPWKLVISVRGLFLLDVCLCHPLVAPFRLPPKIIFFSLAKVLTSIIWLANFCYWKLEWRKKNTAKKKNLKNITVETLLSLIQ